MSSSSHGTGLKPVHADGIHPPFSNYNHAIEIPAGARLLVCSGQLGIDATGTIPEDGAAQVRLCFENIGAILKGGGMDFGDIVRLNAYVTDREIWADYMRLRDEFTHDPRPASTLMMVSGFTREDFRIEIEALAAKVEAS
ncbi:MAG: RidA family protein [Pseudomonadota bacterium]